MRYNIIIICCLFTLYCCKSSILKEKDKTIQIKIVGSETIYPLLKLEVEEFSKKNNSYKINISGGGSNVGIKSLLNGTTDIAMSSRKLTDVEIEEFRKSNKNIIIKKIAFDALSVIVNKTNKVRNLTKQNLKDIFTGKIDNWKNLGGANCEILICSRESSSGSYEYFKEKVLDGEGYSSKILKTKISQAIIQLVSLKPGAIGYVGIAQIRPTIQPVSIVLDDSFNFIYPSISNLSQDKYPLKRPLFLIYERKNSLKLTKMLKFIESSKGQEIISIVGYCKLNKHREN